MEHETPEGLPAPSVSLQQPSRHELRYWLDPRVGDAVGFQADTALRTMAQNFGARRGAAGAAMGLGLALAIAAMTSLVTTSSALLPALWLGLAAVAVFALGQACWRRIHCAAPPIRYVSTGRASTGLLGGWVLGAVMAIVLCSIAHFVLQTRLDSTVAGIIAYAGYQLAIVIGALSAFMLPGFFSHHARADLHRLIDSSPGIRSELEARSLSWVDPVGTRSFGPL